VSVPWNADFGDHLAVDDRAIVVRAVAVVVDAGDGIERPRRGQLRHRARHQVERQLIGERDHGAMALIDDARTALLFAEAVQGITVFGPMPLPSGSVVFVAFDNV
jgi:hypothetical protein